MVKSDQNPKDYVIHVAQIFCHSSRNIHLIFDDGAPGDLPDGDTRLADTHVAQQHDFVVVDVLASVVIKGGFYGCVLVVSG